MEKIFGDGGWKTIQFSLESVKIGIVPRGLTAVVTELLGL